jgi:hypothetical protein
MTKALPSLQRAAVQEIEDFILSLEKRPVSPERVKRLAALIAQIETCMDCVEFPSFHSIARELAGQGYLNLELYLPLYPQKIDLGDWADNLILRQDSALELIERLAQAFWFAEVKSWEEYEALLAKKKLTDAKVVAMVLKYEMDAYSDKALGRSLFATENLRHAYEESGN